MPDIKDITINGVKMRAVLTDPNIGKVVADTKENFSVTATSVNGASLTLDIPGKYLIFSYAYFNAAETTGETYRALRFRYQGTTTSTAGQGQELRFPSNSPVAIQAAHYFAATSADVPVTVTSIVGCNRPCTIYRNSITAIKLAAYPGIAT